VQKGGTRRARVESHSENKPRTQKLPGEKRSAGTKRFNLGKKKFVKKGGTRGSGFLNKKEKYHGHGPNGARVWTIKKKKRSQRKKKKRNATKETKWQQKTEKEHDTEGLKVVRKKEGKGGHHSQNAILGK